MLFFFSFLDEDINQFGYEYLKTLRGETLETDGQLLIIRNSTIGTFHLPRSDEDLEDDSNVNVKRNSRTTFDFNVSLDYRSY